MARLKFEIRGRESNTSSDCPAPFLSRSQRMQRRLLALTHNVMILKS
jgi:hypothetical protein